MSTKQSLKLKRDSHTCNQQAIDSLHNMSSWKQNMPQLVHDLHSYVDMTLNLLLIHRVDIA